MKLQPFPDQQMLIDMQILLLAVEEVEEKEKKHQSDLLVETRKECLKKRISFFQAFFLVQGKFGQNSEFFSTEHKREPNILQFSNQLFI